MNRKLRTQRRFNEELEAKLKSQKKRLVQLNKKIENEEVMKRVRTNRKRLVTLNKKIEGTA